MTREILPHKKNDFIIAQVRNSLERIRPNFEIPIQVVISIHRSNAMPLSGNSKKFHSSRTPAVGSSGGLCAVI
jgi:hypothetical protein